MNNYEEELKVYRNIAMLTGDVFFSYTLADNNIRIFGGDFNTSKYGNNYSGVNNANQGMEKVQNLIKERIDAGMKTGNADFYDKHISFLDSRGELHTYKLVGRLMYDDNNEVESVIGRLERLEDENIGDRYKSAPSGAMDKETFINRLHTKFKKYAGKTCGMLIINIDVENKPQEYLREQIVNIIQDVERIYTYDVMWAIIDYNEIGVFYYGNDIEGAFISKVAEMEMSDKSVNLGMYYGMVKEGDEHMFMYKAWMAMLACKCDETRNVLIVDEANSGAMGNYGVNTGNEVDGEIVERVLDVINSGENIATTIGELLKMVGDRYGIDCISVHEYDEEKDEATLTYQWYDSTNDIVSEKVARKPFENTNSFDWRAGDSIIINNLKLYEGDDALLNKMKSIDVKALMVNRFMSKKGWVTFERHGVAGNWTDMEIAVCKTATKFISAYMLNTKKYFDLVAQEENNKTHDRVTGLMKKDIFEKAMKEYLENNQDKPLALVAVDFDNFTQINDIYSRDVGDEVLKKYADEIRSLEGRFIMGSRTNADNYLILVNQYDERGNKLSAAMMDRNNKNFLQFCSERCPKVELIINAGVALLPKHVDNIYTYMDKAIVAKNKARQDSTIKCVFDY